MGCVTDVVLCGRKINSTHSRCSTCGWTLHLLMINATFRLLLPNFRSSLWTHSSNNSDDIQLFNWVLYRQSKCFAPLKHLGFCDFPMTKIGSLSSPKVLPAAWPVKCTLLCFLPQHFWLLKCMVLLGKLWWNKSNSSASKISSNVYRERIVDKVVLVQAAVISLVTHFDSTATVLKDMP